ncbi:MAG TPA: T9SS type A sorting domain-containing protein [Chitinophagales bacterium]|nr:T9SS type A sorting domain-containing protein [Chitinophagales bacterium]
MKRIIKSIALAAVIICAAADSLRAQNYSLSPDDSIVATAQFDELTVYNILQNNISSDTLFMSWQKVSADVPALWEALICDNNNCYNDLKENGVMHPVPVSEYAFLSVHVTPHTNAGTAIIRYVVWETNNPVSRDTLTWIISAGLTGIENQTTVPVSLILSGDQLFIHGSTGEELRIMNMQGQILLESKMTCVNTAIDLSHYPKGIFLIELQGENSLITKKLFLQ